jgi:hypothetical protein
MTDEPGALDKALERAEKAEAKVERLRALLAELLAVVEGECPSILTDHLAIRIDAALKDRHD